VQYCALSEQIASKQQVSTAQTNERDERDKKRVKEYENMIEVLFGTASAEMSHSINTLVATLKNTLEAKADD
jgi:hypothetical protein